MKNKRSLILFGAFGILAMILFLPTTLGYTGLAIPECIYTTYGTQIGDIEDIQDNDGDVVVWVGQLRWPQFWILAKVYIEKKTDVGTGNTIAIEFKFGGGNTITIDVFYVDGTKDRHIQPPGSWRTVIWALDNNKVVDYVKFVNIEYNAPGILQVDYILVHY